MLTLSQSLGTWANKRILWRKVLFSNLGRTPFFCKGPATRAWWDWWFGIWEPRKKLKFLQWRSRWRLSKVGWSLPYPMKDLSGQLRISLLTRSSGRSGVSMSIENCLQTTLILELRMTLSHFSLVWFLNKISHKDFNAVLINAIIRRHEI